MFGFTSQTRINKPWKDRDGLFNVVVQFEEFDSVPGLENRARKFIAMEGVRDDRWPNIHLVLMDRPDELLYHYREVAV